jgi:hypothetical protein
MSTPRPAWASAEWTSRVAEPFRSDAGFWASLAASADALLSLVAATGSGVILVLAGEGAWSAVPFVVPAGLALRAAAIGRPSSRRSRQAFSTAREWRDAEREAVATAFGHALVRPRGG